MIDAIQNFVWQPAWLTFFIGAACIWLRRFRWFERQPVLRWSGTVLLWGSIGVMLPGPWYYGGVLGIIIGVLSRSGFHLIDKISNWPFVRNFRKARRGTSK